jgi:hypothetical protein
MNLTRERKIYGGLLCLGVLALGIDKMFLSPSEAPAQSAAGLLITNAAPKNLVIAHNKPVVSPTPASAQPGEKPLMGLGALAARMRDMAEVERLDLTDAKDVFRPPVSWVGTIAPTQAIQATVTTVGPAATFRDRHHLIAILKSSKGGMAILDGKSVRPGQTVDGFKLTQVGENSATFEGSGTKIELQLPAAVQLDPLSITPAGR